VPGPIAAPAPRCCRAWRADKQGARGAQDTTLRELAEGWVTLELWCGEERAAIARVKTLKVPHPPPPARARRLRAASVLCWRGIAPDATQRRGATDDDVPPEWDCAVL